MRIFLAVAFFGLLMTTSPAYAEDAAASFLTKLFVNVCIPNMGQPDKIRVWASEHHLQAVTSPTALEIFVGVGEKGGAWAVPASSGSFALSIRGTTEACAVWARTADPSEVEAYFKKLIEGTKRPGIDIRVDQDETSTGSHGQIRSLIYNVVSPPASTSFELSMVTSEQPGGAFQASLQAARATSR